VNKLLKRIYTALIFVFMYAPIIVLIIFSFNDSKSSANWSGFTFDWYIKLFQDRQILKAFYYTIVVAITSSLIATVVGTFAAIAIHNMKGIGKRVLRCLLHI
jgi:spermidine/putrescine transport system permease protein